jgi:hypothetical protein
LTGFSGQLCALKTGVAANARLATAKLKLRRFIISVSFICNQPFMALLNSTNNRSICSLVVAVPKT